MSYIRYQEQNDGFKSSSDHAHATCCNLIHAQKYYNTPSHFSPCRIAGVATTVAVAYSSRIPPEPLSGQLITRAKLRSSLEPDLELNTIIDDPSLAYANTDPWCCLGAESCTQPGV